MPGITGIVCSHGNGKNKLQLSIMTDCLKRESYYTSGYSEIPEIGIYASYVAIKDSFADCMPVTNETGDIVLFMAGECFPDKSELIELKKLGHNFNPDNASFIVHQYEERGETIFDSLNGWYSGLLVDKRSGRSFLFNDRYGIQRINYYEHVDGFAFSSEAKSLLHAFPELRKMNPESVADYIRYDCVLGNKTYFRGIHVLPPGSLWVFEKGNLIKRGSIEKGLNTEASPLSETEFLEAAEETLSRVIPRYFRGNNVAIALTGGLDTRLIMAYANPAPGSTPCFTFGGETHNTHDILVARKIAEACGQKHTVIRLGKEYLDTYPERLQKGIYTTDGLADATNVDGLYLNQLAHSFGTTKVTGKFGSQSFGGTFALRDRSPTAGLVADGFAPMLADAGKRFGNLCGAKDLSDVLFKEIPWYWSRFTAAELCHVAVRSPFLDNDLIALRYRAPQQYVSGRMFHFDAIHNKDPDLASIRTNMGEYGAHTPAYRLPQKWLIHFSNMASKAYGWDRMPHGLHHVMPRLDGIFSLLGIDEPLRNITFFRHYRFWFRKELADFVQNILLDSRTLGRSYWNPRILQKIVDDHITGKRNNLAEIRKVLTLEMIERSLIEDI